MQGSINFEDLPRAERTTVRIFRTPLPERDEGFVPRLAERFGLGGPVEVMPPSRPWRIAPAAWRCTRQAVLCAGSCSATPQVSQWSRQTCLTSAMLSASLMPSCKNTDWPTSSPVSGV
jgi:hypothetical protein